jgi:hypothetical protein
MPAGVHRLTVDERDVRVCGHDRLCEPVGGSARPDYGYVLADKSRGYAEDSTALALAPGNAELLGAVGFDELTLGRWKVAREHLEQAAWLDPRSGATAHCRRVRRVEALGRNDSATILDAPDQSPRSDCIQDIPGVFSPAPGSLAEFLLLTNVEVAGIVT